MELLVMGLFISLLLWLMERKNSPLRPGPCWKCGKTVVWVGLPTGWVHKDTGRAWEPRTFAEYDDLWQNKGYKLQDLEIPHPALTQRSLDLTLQ